MKIKLIALAIITLLAQSICAQNIFKAIVKDGDIGMHPDITYGKN